jgi:hypothetical protein
MIQSSFPKNLPVPAQSLQDVNVRVLGTHHGPLGHLVSFIGTLEAEKTNVISLISWHGRTFNLMTLQKYLLDPLCLQYYANGCLPHCKKTV